MSPYRLCFIIGVLLFSQSINGQYQNRRKKDIGFSGHLSIGLNIPSNYENNTDKLGFLKSVSESASNPGFELAGAVYYKHIGFHLGFGYYKYRLNINKFEKDSKELFSNDSINTFMTDIIRDIPLFTGLSYYLKINNLYIEPEFLVRYNKAIAPHNADIYLWNNNDLVQSINYTKISSLRIDFVPGIRFSYFYPLTKKEKIGIQFSYHYSFSNPNYEYLKKEIDLQNGTVNEKIEKASINYATSNFSFGLILRYN